MSRPVFRLAMLLARADLRGAFHVVPRPLRRPMTARAVAVDLVLFSLDPIVWR